MARWLALVATFGWGVGLATAAGAADVAYVTDMLRLGIHRAADTSDSAFAQLSSGARLEVLERSVLYARVRLDDGREGWVKSAYIVSDVPPRYRLEQLEAEVEALKGQLAESERSAAAADSGTARLRSEHASALGEANSLRAAVARLERQNAEYAERFDASRLSLPLGLVVGALLLTLGFGGVGGWWALDAKIRRQHGGYRVY